ncbi:MAG: molecular chaperone TorD family protein [Candidatus Bipolaricaulota bacterium]|nr:molecular chaperone TorD family protein [Candidatus Bipolaricaulota bacterium]
MSTVIEIELALECSRRYAELAQGFWRPEDLSPGPSPKGEGGGCRSAEYDRLFCHRTTILCPIYEVEYDKNRAVSQGPTLADIAGFYRAFGLELAVSERPDHLALELEFMSILTYKEALALQKNLREEAEICRDAQKKFLEAHLGRWAGIFADTVARASRLECYRALAAELREFIESECSRLRAHPQIVTERPSAVETEDVRCPVART